jgi:hypothetical protein
MLNAGWIFNVCLLLQASFIKGAVGRRVFTQPRQVILEVGSEKRHVAGFHLGENAVGEL